MAIRRSAPLKMKIAKMKLKAKKRKLGAVRQAVRKSKRPAFGAVRRRAILARRRHAIAPMGLTEEFVDVARKPSVRKVRAVGRDVVSTIRSAIGGTPRRRARIARRRAAVRRAPVRAAVRGVRTRRAIRAVRARRGRSIA